jgi:metal-sulfur cluster biosynthetic enzyme
MSATGQTDVEPGTTAAGTPDITTPDLTMTGVSAADISAAAEDDGRPAPDPEVAAAAAQGSMTSSDDAFVDDLLEALKDVVDPELGINVVDLGLIYGVTVDADRKATIDMTLTSAACPLTDMIEDQTTAALEGLVNGHTLNWVWMPPWGPEKITDDGREQLRALGFRV